MGWGLTRGRVTFLGTALLALTAQTAPAAAPSCETLNTAWRRLYHSNFNVRWPNEAFDCPSAVSMVAKAFHDLETAPTGYDYYEWARKIIKVTSYDMACTSYAFFRSTGEMVFCKKFFSTDDEGRVGTLVHEASHGRKSDPGHVTCTHGSGKGTTAACDDVFHGALKGSGYNFEFVYYAQVLESKGLIDLDREVLKTWLKFDLLNKFNRVGAEQRKEWLERIER